MQDLLVDNLSYLENINVTLFEKKFLNDNVNHYIANSLADANHKLTNNDILFVFSKCIDIKNVLTKEAQKEIDSTGRKVKKDDLEKDPTGQIDSIRIGILTEDNIFYEYKIDLKEDSNAQTTLTNIAKQSIEEVIPEYNGYNQSSHILTRQFRSLDCLYFKFENFGELIQLQKNSFQGNKNLEELNREFIKRLK